MRRCFVLLASLALTSPLSAQSLLYRSPNLGGTWVADGGVVQFNFLHRFYVTPGPVRSVNNYPTFTVAVGVGRQAMVGWRFATKGIPSVGATTSNESEVFARWRFLGKPEGSQGLALSVTPAYNVLAESFDAELSADYNAGPVSLMGAFRGMSQPYGVSGGAEVALAAGAIWRLNHYVALSGDYGKLLGADTAAAWSAGISFVIPGSPHTLSLQVSNAGSNTIQGASRGFRGTPERLYGFEFTIPLHLSRFKPWFQRSAAAAAPSPALDGTEVRIAGFKFPDTLTIAAGQMVRWVNDDPVEHTITIAPGGPASPMIRQGASFAHTFTQPGTYTYHCTPHPFMHGTIVVR